LKLDASKMKHKTTNNKMDFVKQFLQKLSIGIVALCAALMLVTCDKSPESPSGSNKLIFTATSVNPSFFSVTATSTITQNTSQSISDHGFCYGTTSNPDLNASVTSLGELTGTGEFSAELTNLKENTSYYIRSFVSFSGGTIYGSQKEITTLKAGKPHISTSALSDITPSSAVCGGTIESDSGYAVTASGICWDTDNQFNENECLGKAINASENSSFSLNIAGLTEGTPYYVKSWASNQKGTSYGEIRSFSSATITIPTVTTNAVTNITPNHSIGGGIVISDGFTTVTARGVCWNTSGSPTLQNCINFTSDGQGTGEFASELVGLDLSTVYFVKAYATNSVGNAYGNQVSFTSDYCGGSLTITHTAGAIAPVDKTVNYGTVQTNLTGSSKCWITQNLGATHQAGNASDANEASAGWYWQFNRKQGFKHDGTTRTPNTTWITSNNENSDWLPVNDPCTLLLGSGWRVPTNTEWSYAHTNGGWNNFNETFASELKLHAAGIINYGSLFSRGTNGNYWSSSQGDTNYGRYLFINKDFSDLNYNNKVYGLSVRCLRD